MAVELVFETHSLTTDNEAGVATGWLDGQLSARGRALATELGQRRRNDAVAAVFASDLGRAVETVELAFGGSDVPSTWTLGCASATAGLERHAGRTPGVRAGAAAQPAVP